jgi:Icc-related predicted phosphoesterase
LPEDALAARLERMMSEVSDATNLVSVVHVPPYDSHLDYAPELDVHMRVQVDGMGWAA